MHERVASAAEAEQRWNARLEKILANALLVEGTRVAVRIERKQEPISFMMSVFDRVHETLEWHWLLLSPGETPPAGHIWTIYEHRGDLGWTGRTAS